MTPSNSNPQRALYLLGCGGHGRVVLDCLKACGLSVRGIIDSALTRGALIDGVAVEGGDEVLAQLDPGVVALCIGVGSMPGKPRRAELFAACRERGFEVLSLLHPSAVIAPRHVFGAGVQVLAGAVLQTGVQLGDNVIVNTRASIDHDCVIANDVMIGPGAVLCGQVRLAEAAYVGAGAVILPATHIGVRAVVGAGAVVMRNVAAGTTVAGNPARPVGASGGPGA
jgi:sugar O-acyltransferase (sialic acid O-acetyltransferase NeuD family)